MAEFQKIAKESKRICETYKTCDGCPIKSVNKGVLCLEWILRNPEEAESIIMKWASEHPITTNSMKFREVFGEDMMTMLTGEHAPLSDWLDAEYKKDEYENGKKSVPPEWIPVPEKPPTKPGRYLVSVSRLIGDYVKTEYFDGKEFDDGQVRAWMPLPKSYRPEGDDKHEG